MAKWWKDRDKWLPGKPAEPSRHDRDGDDHSPVPTEDIGPVDVDESDEFDDVELPDRGIDD